jgi:cellulose synthase/poly-beta-1,6-N-acetylglucosamine synthase-like glycosyltransferase
VCDINCFIAGHMILIFFTILIFTVYAVLLIYYRQNWVSLSTFEDGQPGHGNRQKMTSPAARPTFVSVVIAARNEEKNILSCLESLKAQTYSKNFYEVIVVDDFSTDKTAERVNSFSGNVFLISLKEATNNGKINSYKKKAIETAIVRAKGELIVTCDADCIVPHLWLQTIVSFYEKYSPAFIAAPVAFYGENNFFKIFQALDFMALQGITGAAIHKKFHSMCNGANLAYEKKGFSEVGGFAGIDNIASGDDMLLMHKIAVRFPERILFLKSRAAIVLTKPTASFKEFFHQRIRWASKADKYPDKKITAVLMLVYLFNLWIFLLFIFSFFYHSLLFWSIGLLAGKTMIELYFLYPVATFFGKKRLLWWFPLAEPFHILYTIIAGWLGKFGSYEWKERKVI